MKDQYCWFALSVANVIMFCAMCVQAVRFRKKANDLIAKDRKEAFDALGEEMSWRRSVNKLTANDLRSLANERLAPAPEMVIHAPCGLRKDSKIKTE